MLPIRLELRNFLAYRNPDPLSFKDIDLACLSGPNGAGKSSLLDAMTWVLWGQARAGADELIHMGQDEMLVSFDFRQDQTTYRVVRKRNKKRGQTSLDLLRRDEENQRWIPEASGVRDAQERITTILRLDYDTFVHSAFLQQGKADSFTVKTPAERKRILADILGLSRWDRYEDQTKEKLKVIDEELSVINGRIIEIEQEESKEPALRLELAAAMKQSDEARQAREAAEEHYREVSEAPTKMQHAQAQLVAAQRRVNQYQQDSALIHADLDQQQRRLANYQQIIENRPTIEEGFNQLEAARQIDYDLGDKLVRRAESEQRLHDLERQLDAARAELEAQAGIHLGRIQEAEQTADLNDSVMQEVAEVEAELDRLDKQNAEREVIRDAQKALSEEAVALRTRNEALRLEMNDIKGRIDLLESNGDAICPICRQPLDTPHRAEVLQQYQAEGKTRGDTFRAGQTRLKAIDNLLAEHEVSLREIDADLVNYDALKAREGGLRERLAVIQEAVQRLNTERLAWEDVQQMLATENYSAELRGQITRLRAAIDELGYDRDAHSEAREALTSLRAFEMQKRELDTALHALPDVEAAVQNLQERGERCAAQLAESQTETETFQKDIEVLTAIVQEAQRRQAEVTRLRVVERSATEKLIGVQQELGAIDAARRRKQELQGRRDQLCADQAIYQQLKEAFGKNGVPAMIIEAAIPELEDATNKLLVRMTDGRMHVRFDTQREKKTGGVAETLDILISDELGTRSYDMFSGGERFRVNFALRIALSQFLAHRAGARLQTLVIDEGFGSQDDVGRERLVEAINAIRHDFDMILIVTHIDELRDHFPVRIEVSKTATGSMLAIR